MYEKILIVDDSTLNLRILTDILLEEKFEVFSLKDGYHVLDTALEIRPDVIMLDIMMPGMDGFEVCSLLKRNSEVKDIPVIMATARTNSSDIKCALELGAFDYIKKPVDKIEVIARVQSAIRFKNSQDKLREMAMKDGLTGIYNHTLLIELFESELSRMERNNGKIAFVMIDIDFFKNVNDVYGHMTVDIILKELSDILKSSLRRGDIVGRYGGEEFSIILQGIDKQNAFSLCERIRKEIEDYDFNKENTPIKITVSIGIYLKDSTDHTPGKEIIQKADQALYIAKKNGRNQVVIY